MNLIKTEMVDVLTYRRHATLQVIFGAAFAAPCNVHQGPLCLRTV